MPRNRIKRDSTGWPSQNSDAPSTLRLALICLPVLVLGAKALARHVGQHSPELVLRFHLKRGRCALPVFGILLLPIIAVAAMALSSVGMIGNALRLRVARLD